MPVELLYTALQSEIQKQNDDDKWRQTWAWVCTEKALREKNRWFKEEENLRWVFFDLSLCSVLFFSQITVGFQRNKTQTQWSYFKEKNKSDMDASQATSSPSTEVYWQVVSGAQNTGLICHTFSEVDWEETMKKNKHMGEKYNITV